MNAVIYARYSSAAQKDASIEQQIRECHVYAAAREIRVIGEYCDHALSGRSDARPEFQRMIRDAAKERFQVVICYKTDHFARNRYDSATYKARLKRHGVQVVYVAEPIPEGPEGILLESILEGSAEYYSANLSQNVKRGLLDNALNARLNSPAPYGYRRGSDGKHRVIPEEAAVIREIYELYAHGATAKEITLMLNARGLRTRRNNRFGHTSLRTILKNECYIGVYSYGETRLEDAITPIITKELWALVQKRRSIKTRTAADGHTAERYLLSGKVFCGKCRASMTGMSGIGRHGGKFMYYSCSTRLRSKTCDKSHVQRVKLENMVVDETIARVLQPDIINQLAERMYALQLREQDTSLADSLKARLREVERQIEGFINAIGQGIVTPSTKERLFALEAEKADLQYGIEEASQVLPIISQEALKTWMLQFVTAKDTELTERRKEAIIDAFVTAVYVYDDKVVVVYNYNSEDNSITIEDIEKALSDNGKNGGEPLVDMDCRGSTGAHSAAPCVT